MPRVKPGDCFLVSNDYYRCVLRIVRRPRPYAKQWVCERVLVDRDSTCNENGWTVFNGEEVRISADQFAIIKDRSDFLFDKVMQFCMDKIPHEIHLTGPEVFEDC